MGESYRGAETHQLAAPKISPIRLGFSENAVSRVGCRVVFYAIHGHFLRPRSQQDSYHHQLVGSTALPARRTPKVATSRNIKRLSFLNTSTTTTLNGNLPILIPRGFGHHHGPATRPRTFASRYRPEDSSNPAMPPKQATLGYVKSSQQTLGWGRKELPRNGSCWLTM